MAAATLTPRVRILVVCDDVTPSFTEGDVYTLEGVRQRVLADAFPCRRDLDVYLLLSYPRRGTFAGWVQVVHAESARVIRLQDFTATFDGENAFVPLGINLTNCRFPTPDDYSFEVWFRTRDEESIQKGEIPLFVRQNEV